jgi:hypothetical protein
MKPRIIVGKIMKNLLRQHEPPPATGPERPTLPEKINNLLLYRPKGAQTTIPPIDGMHITGSWGEILAAIQRLHPSRQDLRVYIYPCASLQCLDHTKLKG